MRWGIWCLATGDWVEDEPNKNCLYETRREATDDLADFTINKKDRERYKVRKYGRQKTTSNVQREKIVRPRTERDGLAPLVSVSPSGHHSGVSGKRVER